MENSELSINLMLFNWGLICGESTKFGWSKPLFIFLLNFFSSIKWSIVMFYPIDHPISNYFGDFGYFFGPKLIVDFIGGLIALNSTVLIILFYFCSKFSKNKFDWLKFMHFDSENEKFDKLDLNTIDLQKFTDQFKSIWFILQRLIYLLVVISFSIILISFLVYKHEYYFNYILATIIQAMSMYYFLFHWYGLTMILFQV